MLKRGGSWTTGNAAGLGSWLNRKCSRVVQLVNTCSRVVQLVNRKCCSVEVAGQQENAAGLSSWLTGNAAGLCS